MKEGGRGNGEGEIEMDIERSLYIIYINKRESLSVWRAKNSATRGPILTNKTILESSPLE